MIDEYNSGAANIETWFAKLTAFAQKLSEEAPTGTVTVCGPKLKLSIFTSAFAAEGWSFAVTLGDPANSSTIAITAAAKLATHTLLPVIVLFLSRFDVLAYSLFFGPNPWRSIKCISQLPPPACIP